MSISSNGSCMSVSAFGSDEMALDDAVDRVYLESQQQLNDSHSLVRQLCMLHEQDQDFRVSVELSDRIVDHIDELNNIFKELKSIVKQCSIKPETPEEKQWLKQHVELKKTLKLEAKENVKILKLESKNNMYTTN